MQGEESGGVAWRWAQGAAPVRLDRLQCMPLAYVDVRPFIFLGGLPIFLLLFVRVWLGCRISGGWGRASLVGTAVWAALFALFLTEVGPFVGQRRVLHHRMAWEVRPSPEGAEPLVDLTFVEDPSHFIAFASEELAEYLEHRGEAEVEVRFEVTSDYGQVRGYHATSIAGLEGWAESNSIGGTRGVGTSWSPWE